MNNLFEFNQNAINELEQDVELGKFPVQYFLSDKEFIDVIEFLATLAYPLRVERDKRVRFIKAIMGTALKASGYRRITSSKVLLNLKDLTQVKVFEKATVEGFKRLTNGLRHVEAFDYHIRSQFTDSPKTMAESLYSVMDNYRSEYVKGSENSGGIDFDNVKSNQRKAYQQSLPVLHYFLAYWKVLSAKCMDPQNCLQAIAQPEWLPEVLDVGDSLLANQNRQHKILLLERGEKLNRFVSEEKVIIFNGI